MPPSLTLTTSTIAPGGTVLVSGFGEPSAAIDLWVVSQSSLRGTFEATTTVNKSGAWSYALTTTKFSVDTYQVEARSLVTGYAASDFSQIAYLGVGQAPKPKVGLKGDLNHDGKVNLADFSILLYHWGQNWPQAEFDGKTAVDLSDLSIMLYNWTG